MHRPLRPASAEHATVTLAAAYEGAVMMTAKCLNPALTCPDEGVRVGAYNAWVTSTPAPTRALPTLSAPAALAVTR